MGSGLLVWGGGYMPGRGRALASICQACRDLVTPATLAFEGQGDQDQAVAERSWKEAATEFWLRTAKDDEQEKLKVPKLYRTALIQAWVDFSFWVKDKCQAGRIWR